MKYFIIILLILTSCSPNYYLRKAERAIKKAEQRGSAWHSDTVFKIMEVKTVRIQFDTIVKNVNFTDTITLIKDKIVTKVKVNTVTKEVFVDVEVPADTIRVEVPVIVNKSIKAGKGFWYYAIRGLLLAILAFVAGYLLRAKTGKDLTIRFDKDQEPVK